MCVFTTRLVIYIYIYMASQSYGTPIQNKEVIRCNSLALTINIITITVMSVRIVECCFTKKQRKWQHYIVIDRIVQYRFLIGTTQYDEAGNNHSAAARKLCRRRRLQMDQSMFCLYVCIYIYVQKHVCVYVAVLRMHRALASLIQPFPVGRLWHFCEDYYIMDMKAINW